MGMDKTAGRAVTRVAVDRGWGALDIVTATGAGRRARCREPLPRAGSRSWTWGPGRCGVWGWKGAAGQRALCLGLLDVFFRGMPTGTCRREHSDGEGGQVVTIWHMLWGTHSALGAGDMAVDRGVLTVPEGKQITGKKPHK